jgi:hypothetical protein
MLAYFEAAASNKKKDGLLSGEELDDAARATGVELPQQERSALKLLVYAVLSHQYMRQELRALSCRRRSSLPLKLLAYAALSYQYMRP